MKVIKGILLTMLALGLFGLLMIVGLIMAIF